MNYMAKVMEEKYGIPWMEFNFFGPTQIAKSLREITEKLASFEGLEAHKKSVEMRMK